MEDIRGKVTSYAGTTLILRIPPVRIEQDPHQPRRLARPGERGGGGGW